MKLRGRGPDGNRFTRRDLSMSEEQPPSLNERIGIDESGKAWILGQWQESPDGGLLTVSDARVLLILFPEERNSILSRVPAFLEKEVERNMQMTGKQRVPLLEIFRTFAPDRFSEEMKSITIYPLETLALEILEIHDDMEEIELEIRNRLIFGQHQEKVNGKNRQIIQKFAGELRYEKSWILFLHFAYLCTRLDVSLRQYFLPISIKDEHGIRSCIKKSSEDNKGAILLNLEEVAGFKILLADEVRVTENGLIELEEKRAVGSAVELPVRSLV